MPPPGAPVAPAAPVPPVMPITTPGPMAIPGDPHAIGAAFGRLGNSQRKAAKTAVGILSVMLEEGELVECVVAGKVNEADGLVCLTTKRLIVLNDRQWVPDRISLEVDQLMTVRGEAAGTTATITIVREMHQAVIQKVSDVQLAQELAQRIRTRAAGG